jgi:nucleoside 2-deoxyribosyltransferase
MKKRTLVYVIGKYAGNVKENIQKAEEIRIALVKAGYHVITPHKNTSGYEKYEDGTISYRTWIEMDLNILSRCDAVFIMDNTENSHGSQIEIEFARSRNIPEVKL